MNVFIKLQITRSAMKAEVRNIGGGASLDRPLGIG